MHSREQDPDGGIKAAAKDTFRYGVADEVLAVRQRAAHILDTRHTMLAWNRDETDYQM